MGCASWLIEITTEEEAQVVGWSTEVVQADRGMALSKEQQQSSCNEVFVFFNSQVKFGLIAFSSYPLRFNNSW